MKKLVPAKVIDDCVCCQHWEDHGPSSAHGFCGLIQKYIHNRPFAKWCPLETVADDGGVER